MLPPSLKPAQNLKSCQKSRLHAHAHMRWHGMTERRRQRVLFFSHVPLLDFEYCIWYRAQSFSLLLFLSWVDPTHFYQNGLDENNLKSASFVGILNTIWKADIFTRVCLTRCYIHPGCYTIVPTVLLDLATEIITIHFRKQDFQSFLLQLSYFQLYCFLQKVLRVSDECHVFFLIFFQFDVLLNKSILEISVSYSGVTKHNS